MTPATNESHPARGASTIALLAGLWLFVSPWVYGASGNASAWNTWIIGALIFVCAAIRRSHLSATGLSWLNSLLGVWIFVSPWVYGYDTGQTGRLINSLFIGFVVLCSGLAAANSERMSHDMTSTA